MKEASGRPMEAPAVSTPLNSRLCLCGAAGVACRRRSDGRSGFVWRCEFHSAKWPDYAQEM